MENRLDADKTVVAIIDRNARRRDKLAEAFEGLAEVQLSVPKGKGKGTWRTLARGGDLERLGPATVTLRHVGDPKTDADVETAVTILYGGDGPVDPRIPSDAPEVIQRPITAGEGILRPGEARELLEYVRMRYLKKVEDAARPSFLTPQSTSEFLPAVLILCQGYLAVHACAGGDVHEHPAVTSALSCMGWTALVEKGDAFVEAVKLRLHDKCGDVSQPAWWEHVLFQGKLFVERRIAAELRIGSLAEKPAVENLLHAIYVSKLITPAVVAEAYCALTDQMRCSQSARVQ